MKHISLFKWLILAVLLPITVSCDDIDEADRVTLGNQTKKTVDAAEAFYEVDGELFTVVNQNRLLIEDFTGWKCVNCPAIADFLTRKITPIYPSILVSLHMTSNTFSAKHPNGFNCESADSICNQINGDAIASQLSLPSVCINNEKFDESKFSSDTTAIANKALDVYASGLTETRADVAVNVSKTEEGKYKISTLIVNCQNTNCKLQLWLIEEDLVSTAQQSQNGWIRDYENHGILREVINGSYEGQLVQMNQDNKALVRHTLDISGKDYVPANCCVVAVVLQNESNRVLNCISVNLE